jgi:hypothetical protein
MAAAVCWLSRLLAAGRARWLLRLHTLLLLPRRRPRAPSTRTHAWRGALTTCGVTDAMLWCPLCVMLEQGWVWHACHHLNWLGCCRIARSNVTGTLGAG